MSATFLNLSASMLRNPSNFAPCAAWLWLTLVACAPVLADETPQRRSPQPDEIAGWIKDLGSDAYVRRERATTLLSAAGPAALDPLAEAADRGNLETASRAVRLLMSLARSDDLDTSLQALERISSLENRPVERAAAETMLASMREKRAFEKLTGLGGEFPNRYVTAGEIVYPHLHLGEGFKGDDEAFKSVKDLVSLQMLTVHGAEISDEAIKNLHEMPNLTVIQLYGTKVTSEGCDALREALPRTKIEYRRGAFLGVQGAPFSDGGGALITSVVPGSAAADAGILAGDRIIKYDDVVIRDFPGLTDEIAKCRPGDKAKLVIRRGNSEISMEVAFGKWR